MRPLRVMTRVTNWLGKSCAETQSQGQGLAVSNCEQCLQYYVLGILKKFYAFFFETLGQHLGSKWGGFFILV